MPDPSPVQPHLRREIGLRDLVLFNVAAVVGIRWLAAAAHAGSGSLLLWALAAALFFVPSALSVAALTRRYPEEGGLYIWTKQNFGDWHGFLAGWCYWLSNLFYFPNLLLAGVGIAAYTLGPRYSWLAENRVYMLGAAFVLLWASLLSHLFGVRHGKWTGNIGGMATYLAGALVILAGLAAWLRGPSMTPLRLLPEWNLDKINFWSQIAFAFGGLELGAVMGGEIRQPGKTVPRAAFLSGAAITGFYVLGTLALLILLPSGQISVMTGLAQAGQAAGERLGFVGLGPLLALLITLGLLGQLGAWVGGSARIPFVIGLDSYLPPAFAKLHPRWGTPWFSLLSQGAACSVFLLVMLTGESLQAGYQLLVDMTVVTYFVPFVYIFLCAWRCGQRLAAVSGLFTTACGIGFSLVPPEGTVSPILFVAKLLAGCAALIFTGKMTFNRAMRLQGQAAK